MSASGEADESDSEIEIAPDVTVEPAPLGQMLESLRSATGEDFGAYESRYRSFMSGVELAVQESEFYGALLDIYTKLSSEFVVGKIRAVEAWADGENTFRVVQKSWESVIDKLFRINLEENAQPNLPPLVNTIYERASGENPRKQRWITPDLAHEVADDLLRTKFVAPFADGVIDVSERITKAINTSGLLRFQRFHAKDSGYHARHHYILLPVPGYDGNDTSVALEVKVLTKMQDTLSELTHLLYEQKRTGHIQSEPKRRLAWLFESPDFLASYVGHSGHFIEASMVQLKNKIHGLEEA